MSRFLASPTSGSPNAAKKRDGHHNNLLSKYRAQSDHCACHARFKDRAPWADLGNSLIWRTPPSRAQPSRTTPASAVGAKKAALSRWHMTATTTSSGALSCSASCSSCVAAIFALAGLASASAAVSSPAGARGAHESHAARPSGALSGAAAPPGGAHRPRERRAPPGARERRPSAGATRRAPPGAHSRNDPEMGWRDTRERRRPRARAQLISLNACGVAGRSGLRDGMASGRPHALEAPWDAMTPWIPAAAWSRPHGLWGASILVPLLRQAAQRKFGPRPKVASMAEA